MVQKNNSSTRRPFTLQLAPFLHRSASLTLNQEVDIIWWITLPKEDCAGTKGHLPSRGATPETPSRKRKLRLPSFSLQLFVLFTNIPLQNGQILPLAWVNSHL
jgi:hypothetical protein